MNNAAKLLRAFSKINWVVFGFFTTLLCIGLILAAIYWISIFFGSTLGTNFLSLRDDPKFKDVLDLNANVRLLFECARLAIDCLLNALVFKALARFLNERSSDGNLQSKMLSRVPAYLVALYFISFIEILNLAPSSQNTEQWLSSHSISMGVLDHLLPNFGGPLGLVLAGIIYLFRKNLDDQTRLSGEVFKLKQEAELVI